MFNVTKIAADNFSYQEVQTDGIIVPIYQQMLVFQEWLLQEEFDVTVDGEVVLIA